MSELFVGAGTVLNVAAILVGSTVGALLGERLPARTRDVVTDGLGLVTLLVAGLNLMAVREADYLAAVGSGWTVLVVLGAILLGGIAGSLLRVEDRLESLGGALQRRLGGAGAAEDRRRFIEGFVDASLLFCVGPLAILGSLQDGLGQGIDQLALKATLDGFASIALAASLGWGVAASALSVVVVQGTLTALGWAAGDVLPSYAIAALTATGGLLIVGIALRLLKVKMVPVGDLLPALAVAPALAWLAASLL